MSHQTATPQGQQPLNRQADRYYHTDSPDQGREHGGKPSAAQDAKGFEETGLSFTALLAMVASEGNADDLLRYAIALQTEGWHQTFPRFSDLLSDMNCPVSLRAFQGTTEPLAHKVSELHARWHLAGGPLTEWPSNAEEILTCPYPREVEG